MNFEIYSWSCGSSVTASRFLAKEKIAGSNPVSRSSNINNHTMDQPTGLMEGRAPEGIRDTAVPRLSGIGSLFSKAFERWKRGIIKYILISIVPLAAIFLLSLLFLGSQSFNPVASVPTTIVVVLAAVVLGIVYQTALVEWVLSENLSLGVAESYRRGLGSAARLLWTGILTGLLTLGAFLLFVIPGIAFLVWFFAIQFVVIGDHVGGFEAITRSYSYVKGNWWGVFGRLLLLWLIAVVLGLVFGQSTSLAGKILYQIILGLFYSPFAIMYAAELYKELKGMNPTAQNITPRPKFIWIVGLAGYGVLVLLVLRFVLRVI